MSQDEVPSPGPVTSTGGAGSAGPTASRGPADSAGPAAPGRLADSADPDASPLRADAARPADSPGPLAGVRVLDLSAYIAGPYGCTLLADLGAEVVKVEPPGGDNLRNYPSSLAAESRAFLGINRNKLGLALDLKQPEGLAALHRLLTEADVLVHNFRPAVPERLGIAYEQLRQAHPRLIYCAMTGYGEEGPLKDKAGYDQVLQSMSGICAMQAGQGEPPQIVYGSVVDYYAASLLALGVTAALVERARSGHGQFVGISLLRSALAMQSARLIWAEGEEREVWRDMRSGGITGLHPTREGFLYLSANTPHFWRALCRMVGLAELGEDPRYDSVRKRAEHAADIVPPLRAALRARTALQWEAHFGDAVPCAAVRQPADMFDHPQVLAEGMVANFRHPVVGQYVGLDKPVKFGRTPGPSPFAAPTFAQHADAILARNGYSEGEIARLRELGVIPPAS